LQSVKVFLSERTHPFANDLLLYLDYMAKIWHIPGRTLNYIWHNSIKYKNQLLHQSYNHRLVLMVLIHFIVINKLFSNFNWNVFDQTLVVLSCCIVLGSCLERGLNFIDVLRTAFTLVDPKSVKRHWWPYCIFTLSGSMSAKAVRRTLMKLTLEKIRKLFYLFILIYSSNDSFVSCLTSLLVFTIYMYAFLGAVIMHFSFHFSIQVKHQNIIIYIPIYRHFYFIFTFNNMIKWRRACSIES